MRTAYAVGMLLALLPIMAIGLSGCAISLPFKGPGYDPAKGVTRAGPDDTVVVALTNAVVDRGKRAPFDDHTARVADAIATQPGFVGFSMRKRLFGNEVWTMTVWATDADRQRFVSSASHRAAMAAGVPSLISARFRRIEVPAKEIPLSWNRALALLAEEGQARSYDFTGGSR